MAIAWEEEAESDVDRLGEGEEKEEEGEVYLIRN